MKRVLVVESSDALSQMICESLRAAAIEPVPCLAPQAPRLAAGLPADAVVLALAGLQIDRTPLYRALKDDSRTASIPLILCTGHRNATVSRRLGEKPPYLIFKPFDLEFLVKVVELALKENEGPQPGAPAR
jgi:DNA-binding response OmpR family regulator